MERDAREQRVRQKINIIKNTVLYCFLCYDAFCIDTVPFHMLQIITNVLCEFEYSTYIYTYGDISFLITNNFYFQFSFLSGAFTFNILIY